MAILAAIIRLIAFIATTTISTVGGVMKFALGFVLVMLILLVLVVFGLLHLAGAL